MEKKITRRGLLAACLGALAGLWHRGCPKPATPAITASFQRAMRIVDGKGRRWIEGEHCHEGPSVAHLGIQIINALTEEPDGIGYVAFPFYRGFDQPLGHIGFYREYSGTADIG